jgi:hypothetical protein
MRTAAAAVCCASLNMCFLTPCVVLCCTAVPLGLLCAGVPRLAGIRQPCMLCFSTVPQLHVISRNCYSKFDASKLTVITAACYEDILAFTDLWVSFECVLCCDVTLSSIQQRQQQVVARLWCPLSAWVVEQKAHWCGHYSGCAVTASAWLISLFECGSGSSNNR